MHRSLFAAALAVLPAAALAQPGDKTYIDVRVRVFGTSDPFVDNLSFIRPDHTPADVEVGLFYYRERGDGLSTVVHNIVGFPYSAALGDSVTILDRTDSSLHPDGRVGNFNFGGQFQMLYHTGTTGVDANRFRIAANNNPDDAAAGGVSVKQNTPVALGTNFNGADGVFGYHFKLTMACAADGSSRTMMLDAPKNRINSFTVYNGGDFPPVILDTDVATVTLSVPAPASFSALALAGLVTPRRRRPA